MVANARHRHENLRLRDDGDAEPVCGAKSSDNEEGFALLLTIFIITITTILVVEFADTVRSFQRSSRTFSDQVRGVFILKSAVNIGKMLIEAPKLPDRSGIDSLSDPWALIGSAPNIPIEGFPGDLRLEITDEDSKLDVNALVSNANQFGSADPNTPPQPVAAPSANDASAFYRGAFRDLFFLAGFLRERYEPQEYRTLGNNALEAPEQVATIIDWMDKDSEPFKSPDLESQGIESSSNKTWFFNRPFRSLAELALVPGMTLERVGAISRFVRVSQAFPGIGARTVNVNTAPLEVLLAMGMPQNLAEEIVSKRMAFPYGQDTLTAIIGVDPKLAGKLAVRSNEFMVLARVNLSTRILWVRAFFSVQHQGLTNKAILRLLEFY